jgi:hypothetical protein
MIRTPSPGTGHQTSQQAKPTAALRPGDSIRITGLGAFTIAATSIPLPRTARTREPMVCVPLGWAPLAIAATADTVWDAASVDPPIWRPRSCPACGGSGRCPDPWNWTGGRR